VKILQLMPQFPFPPTDGGKVGLANITKHFSTSGNNVTVICNWQGASPDAILEASTYATWVIVDHSTRNTPWQIIKSVFSRRPLYISKQEHGAFEQAIANAFSVTKFDVIHADHTSMAGLAKWASEKYNVPWGLRLHNIEHVIWQRYAERLSLLNPKRWYLAREASKLMREEHDLMSKADILFPITYADATLLPFNAAPFVIAPAGVDVADWNSKPQFENQRVVMASSFSWIHNAEALMWFIKNVWPIVLARVPNAEFHVCGKDVPQWVWEYQGEKIVVRDFVPDLAAFYSECSVSVSPLFVGSGMRLKIIEAMAAGLPVVATSIGAEGIDATEHHGLFVADAVEAQAELVISLLTNIVTWRQASAEARDFAAERYTWHRAVALMIDAYKRIMP